MRIHGSFTSKDFIEYSVELYDDTPNSGEQIEIGYDGVFFADDPVNIQREIEDSFTVVITHTCEISLQTNRYLGDILFSPTLDRYVTVTDETNSKVVFKGYIQPLTFEQPYVYHLDEFTVNCIDYLGGLEFSKWKGLNKNTYYTAKSSASTVTAREMIEGVLCNPQYGAQFPLSNIFYDCSIGVNSGGTKTVLSDVRIDENTLFGENYDSLKYNNEVMEMVLRYFNLHAIQIGDVIYLFNWKTLRDGRNTWVRFAESDTYQDVTISAPTRTVFTGDLHADSDNSLTIDDVYAQIQVKDNIEEIEAVIASPFEDTDIGWYYDKQLLVTEYMSGGNGETAYNAFRDMILDDGSQTYNDNHYEAGKIVDHYFQHLYANNWKYYVKYNGVDTDIDELVETDSSGRYINQIKIADALYNPNTSPNVGLISVGAVEKDLHVTDNSPKPKLEMTPYICISLNGNMIDEPSLVKPSQSDIAAHTKFIEYKSPQTNVTYSPIDSSYENYLVFSGEILLQKRQTDTLYDTYGYTYTGVRSKMQNPGGDTPWFFGETTFPSIDGNDYGMYYTRRWYESTYANGDPVTRANGIRSLQPPSVIDNENTKLFKYEYSYKGNSEDKYYKLPLLECELIIGNKRLIETSWGQWGEDKYPSYEWVTIGEEPTQTYTDDQGQTHSYTLTTFTLGIDPEIDEYVIGESHDIQNTVDFKKMNLSENVKGTAIKITKDDNLSGELTFRIKGPVFCTWNPNFQGISAWFNWLHLLWGVDEAALLAHCENMLIKDFKCELKTNAPNTSVSGSTSDIIYVSAEENYPSIKDDIEFDIVTQPSLSTCLAIGAEYVTAKNSARIVNGEDSEPLTDLFDATIGENAEPEKLYVNQYYGEYHTPKILLKGTYHMREDEVWRNTFTSSPLGTKNFYIKEIGQSLRWNTAEITFKQI